MKHIIELNSKRIRILTGRWPINWLSTISQEIEPDITKNQSLQPCWIKFIGKTRLCSNGARSPEATNIWFRASEKNYPVARPGTLAYCISSR